MVTKWPQNWSPVLILGAFCAVLRARTALKGSRAKFGLKYEKNRKIEIKSSIPLTFW